MRFPVRSFRRFDPLPDGELLARYAQHRDPAAFEVLVWRHGPLVLGVCRRHLPAADADDAFQATFLVLARKAGGVRADTLPGWLHRVARRAAVRAAAKQRTRREAPLTTDPEAKPPPDAELAGLLDAEIDRLPDRQRQAVVLCYLDGLTAEEAAVRLGVPRGTVLSRLHAARATLAGRLSRRGVVPPAVGLTAAVTAGHVAGWGGRTGAAVILANEVMVMGAKKLILAAACGVVLVGGGGTGLGVLTAQNPGPPTPAPKVEPVAEPAKKAAAAAEQQRKDILAKLSNSMRDESEMGRRAADLTQQIDLVKKNVAYFEGELTRLNALRARIEAQRVEMHGDAARWIPYLLDAGDVTAAADLHRKMADKLVELADLRRTRDQAKASGKPDPNLDHKLLAVAAEVAGLRAKVIPPAELVQWERKLTESLTRHFDQQDQLRVAVNEIADVTNQRRKLNETLIKLNDELTAINYSEDRLTRLRAHRDRIQFELEWGTHPDPTVAKLDAILAELNALRDEVRRR
jgi:RNA polymerase sigma factor (sigma-70 family)